MRDLQKNSWVFSFRFCNLKNGKDMKLPNKSGFEGYFDILVLSVTIKN